MPDGGVGKPEGWGNFSGLTMRAGSGTESGGEREQMK